MSYHSTTMEYSAAAVVAILIFLVFVNPPQIVVYETVDETQTRVCNSERNELKDVNQKLTLQNGELAEKLRVCEKYKPEGISPILYIIWIPMLVWAGFSLRGVWDDHLKVKRLEAEARKAEAEKEAPK